MSNIQPGQIIIAEIGTAAEYLWSPLANTTVRQPAAIDDLDTTVRMAWDVFRMDGQRVGGRINVHRFDLMTMTDADWHARARYGVTFDLLVSYRPERAFIYEALNLWRPPIDDFQQVQPNLLAEALKRCIIAALTTEDGAVQDPQVAFQQVIESVLPAIREDVERAYIRLQAEAADTKD